MDSQGCRKVMLMICVTSFNSRMVQLWMESLQNTSELGFMTPLPSRRYLLHAYRKLYQRLGASIQEDSKSFSKLPQDSEEKEQRMEIKAEKTENSEAIVFGVSTKSTRSSMELMDVMQGPSVLKHKGSEADKITFPQQVSKCMCVKSHLASALKTTSK